MSFDGLPDSWTVWNEDPDGRAVLAYRPDVFEGESYPPACLPTIYVSQRPPDRPMRRSLRGPGDEWHVAFHLEPEVRVRECDATRETRADAVAAAVDVAERFDRGEIDYRAAYQVPREAYLDALDDLTGQEVSGGGA